MPTTDATRVSVPAGPIDPDHTVASAPPPLAVQSLASVDVQVSSKELPIVMLDALVCRLAVNVVPGESVTMSCACVEVGATAFAEMLSHVSVKVNCPSCDPPPGVYI